MVAYYNEIDKNAAAWLRELIKQGHIAPGDVDERDIRDIKPTELAGYAQCHFFAGIGGWSLALRLAGWPDDRPVWTGSCPCQPFSAAGARGGMSDERHLWPHWHHLISQCRPATVFGEQVASKDGLGWLDLVSADMEATGYAFAAEDICAAGVGAPHIRQRLWFVGLGNASGAAGQRDAGSLSGTKAGKHGARLQVDGRLPVGYEHAGSSMGRLADANGQHIQRGSGKGDGASSATEGEARQRQRSGDDDCAGRADGRLADADSEAGSGRGIQRPGQGNGESVGATCKRPAGLRADDGLADAMCSGQPGQREVGRPCNPAPQADRQEHRAVDAGGRGRLADADGDGRGAGRGIRSNGEKHDAQYGGSSDSVRRSSALDSHWRDADWLFCRDGKWRPVEPSTFPLAHGLPARVGRLRGYGNAIVPQVAATWIEAVMECA